MGEGLAIYPQGGKTALDYGGIPRRPGVALDTTALNQVIDYPAADMTITVEAGIPLATMQAVLATEGQFFPLDAPLADRATLGGIFATNTCGPRRLGWGRPRDLILGVSFVTSDGKEVKGGGRVVKNVAGYDFPKLLTGSMGTLGLITRMTLKVRPRPEASALVLVPFDRGHDLAKTLERLESSVTRPTALEVLNRPAIGLAGIEGPDSAFLLIAGFEDNAASVAWQVENLEIPRGDRRVLMGEEAAPAWKGLSDFAAKEAGALSLVVSLPRSRGAAYMLERPWDDYAWRWHAGSGVIQAHALRKPPGGGVDESSLNAARRRAVEDGGSLTLARCPTDAKERLKVWGDRRGDWAVMERIKEALDPSRAMNPGRFVGTI